MSSNRPSEPLQIDLRFSPRLALFLLVAHGATLTLTPLLTLPIWAACGVVVGVAVSLARTLYTHVLLRGKHTVVRLMWGSDGRWVLVYTNGMVRNADLLPGSFVHPYLVVLTFHVPEAHFLLSRRSVVIAADAVHPATFRHLRVRLRSG